MAYRNYTFTAFLKDIVNGQIVGARYSSIGKMNNEIPSILDISFLGARLFQKIDDMKEILEAGERKVICIYGNSDNNHCFNLFSEPSHLDTVIGVEGVFNIKPIGEKIFVNDVYYNGFVVRYKNPQSGYNIENFLINISRVLYKSHATNVVWAKHLEIVIDEIPRIVIGSNIKYKDVTHTYQAVMEKRLRETLEQHIFSNLLDIKEDSSDSNSGIHFTIKVSDPDSAFINIDELPNISVDIQEYVKHNGDTFICILRDGGFRVEAAASPKPTNFAKLLGYFDEDGYILRDVRINAYNFSKIGLYRYNKHRVTYDCRQYHCGNMEIEEARDSFSEIEDIVQIFDEVSRKGTITVSRGNRFQETVFYRDYVFSKDNTFGIDIDTAVKTANEIIGAEGLSYWKDRHKIQVIKLNSDTIRLEYVIERDDIDS